jgi:predicted Zn-dependent protease
VDELLAEAEAASRADPLDGEAQVTRALVRSREGGIEEIFEAWRTLPGDPTVGLALARILAGEGQVNEALPILEAVLAHHPDHPTASFEVARLRMEQPDAGADRLERAVGLLETAAEGGEGARALPLLAEAAWRRGDLGRGFAALGRAWRLGVPEAPWTVLVELAQTARNAAVALAVAELALDSGRLAEADETLQIAEELAADSAASRRLRWRFLVESGRLEELARRPGDANREDAVARIVAAANEPAELERIVAELTDDDSVLLAGAILLRRGRLDAAERVYRRLVADGTAGSEAFRGLAGLLLGQGRTEEAVILLQGAVRQGRATPQIHVLLGLALARQGKAAAALSAVEHALAEQPLSAAAWQVRGTAHLVAGRPREAVGDLRRALELGTQRSSVWSNLAVAYRFLGDSKAEQEARARADQLTREENRRPATQG